MLCDLIIDGNYILNKNVFVLHKNNALYGSLNSSLERNIEYYRKLFFFENVYLVSDSKEKSWRKNINYKYKKNRKKNTDIDWEFVYNAYNEFKNKIKGRIKILEAPNIEGDDWITFLTKKSNDNKRSTLIVSNDKDIFQLINYSIDPLYINIMINEIRNREKIFLPKNYNIFIDFLSKIPTDLFELDDNSEFIRFIKYYTNKYEVCEIDSLKSFFIKIISGDINDSIESVYKTDNKNKNRGIGKKGAENIYMKYIKEFGDVDFNDVDVYENIADIICEEKKISKTNINKIVENLKNNVKLIDLKLENYPKNILDKMHHYYNVALENKNVVYG